MKNKIAHFFIGSMLFGAVSLPAQVVNAAPPVASTWHAQSLWQAILNLLLFACIGVLAAIAGYKIFDKCTPGNLTKEILEHRNVAAAIIGAAVILGVCIIVAASMLG